MYLNSVEMGAIGNVIIGQGGESLHETIFAYLCGKSDFHFLFFFCYQLKFNNQSIKPTITQLSYIYSSFSTSCDSHLQINNVISNHKKFCFRGKPSH